MIKIAVTKNEEIINKITKTITKKRINSGSITLIGAVDSCYISTMPTNDAKKDMLQEFHEPLEVTGTGEIQNGKVHIHIVLGREDKTAISGHLHWGKVKTWFVNVYVSPLEEL